MMCCCRKCWCGRTLRDMAKKPTKPAKPQPATGRSPVVNVRLGHDRERALAIFIAAQKVPPDKTAVILAALDKFLAAENLWPPEHPTEKG